MTGSRWSLSVNLSPETIRYELIKIQKPKFLARELKIQSLGRIPLVQNPPSQVSFPPGVSQGLDASVGLGLLPQPWPQLALPEKVFIHHTCSEPRFSWVSHLKKVKVFAGPSRPKIRKEMSPPQEQETEESQAPHSASFPMNSGGGGGWALGQVLQVGENPLSRKSPLKHASPLKTILQARPLPFTSARARVLQKNRANGRKTEIQICQRFITGTDSPWGGGRAASHDLLSVSSRTRQAGCEIQSACAGLRTRAAAVSPRVWRLENQGPGCLLFKERQEKVDIPAPEERETFPFLHLFVLFGPSKWIDWLKLCALWRGETLFTQSATSNASLFQQQPQLCTQK